MASSSEEPSSDYFADESCVESDVSESDNDCVLILSSDEDSCRTDSSSAEEQCSESGNEQELRIVWAVKKDDSIGFTEDEDKRLKRALEKYGWGKWSQILGVLDSYRFNPYRTGECLRRRAHKLNLKERLNKQ